MTQQNYSIDLLNERSVSIVLTSYYNNMILGEPHRRAYMNSKADRDILFKDPNIPKNVLDAVHSIWGDVPTVSDNKDI